MKWYRNKKIKSKLILGFLIVSIIAAIVGGFGMLTIVQIEMNADEMYRKNATCLQYAGMAAMKTQSVVSSAQMISKLDISQKGTINAYSNKMQNIIDEVDGLLVNLSDVVNDELRESTFGEISTNWGYLKKYIGSFVEYMNEGDSTDLANSAIKLANTAAGNLTDQYTMLIEQVSGEASNKAAANSVQATIALIVMGSILAAAIVISLMLGFTLSKNIGNPLKVMAAAGMRIAEGDVNVDDILTEKDRALSEREDEIGTLAKMVDKLVGGARLQAQEAQLVAQGDLTVDVNLKSDRDLLGLSLQELVDNFHNMAQSIVQAADKVALSSDAVSNSSIVLSQGATEQASAIEQLNATIEGISRQTELNAENAAQANDLAQRAKQNALNGNSQMKEMLLSMQEISESSKNINKVVKVIDDIAFQTNILALNAAVEAARAGQAGRGFAVVAEEVRNLAAKSAQAVKDTTEMIEGSIKKVAAGTKIANDTADALNEILSQVEKSAELVGAIDIASREQAQGIEQIGQGITQVSQVVQTNAATAEESAAASEELSGQASQLKEFVAVFKLRGSAEIMVDADDFRDFADSAEEDTGSENVQAIFLEAHDDTDVYVSAGDKEFGKY